MCLEVLIVAEDDLPQPQLIRKPPLYIKVASYSVPPSQVSGTPVKGTVIPVVEMVDSGYERLLRNEESAESHDAPEYDGLAKYFRALDEKNVTPLWTAMDKMVPLFPKPRAIPTS